MGSYVIVQLLFVWNGAIEKGKCDKRAFPVHKLTLLIHSRVRCKQDLLTVFVAVRVVALPSALSKCTISSI